MLDSPQFCVPGSRDRDLRRRAAAVLPGGLWGHLAAKALPEGYPQFFARVEGCHLLDVDGRRFTDMMCSWGPVVLGHHHAAVERAAMEQAGKGDRMNGPAPVLVELAELVVDMIPHAEWCHFGENGTDATRQCVAIARAATGRRTVLVAYGAPEWAHSVRFVDNDLDSLACGAAQAGDDLAAILVSPFRPVSGQRQELPTEAFARGVRALADATGATLILDDVRAGFRLGLGGTWEGFEVQPDLSSWGKAIGNGYAVAAVTGRERFRDAAATVFTTESFWCGAVAMAAAVATLSELRRGGCAGAIARARGAAAGGFGGAGDPAWGADRSERAGADADAAVCGRSGMEAGERVLCGDAAAWGLPASEAQSVPVLCAYRGGYRRCARGGRCGVRLRRALIALSARVSDESGGGLPGEGAEGDGGEEAVAERDSRRRCGRRRRTQRRRRRTGWGTAGSGGVEDGGGGRR